MSELIALEDINVALETLTFTEVRAGEFQLIGKACPWIFSFCPDLKPNETVSLQAHFVFLESFIEQAHEQFEADNISQLGSGPWSERDLSDCEHNLSAIAMEINEAFVIQIRRINASQRYHQRIFQKAREYSLEYEHLNKDKEYKEVLIHAIVHDLSGPLTSIGGALHLLADASLDAEIRAELQHNAESQVESAHRLIKSILDVFVLEEKAFDPSTLEFEHSPDILECIESIITNFNPAFKQQSVTLALNNQLSENRIRVISEVDQLTRVLINLLENALRYSPIKTKVTIELQDSPEDVSVSIIDSGPGVPAEIRDSLFKRFVGGQEFGGKAGFGLYYCQMCVQKWGGKIKYENIENADKVNQGACFQIELRKSF